MAFRINCGKPEHNEVAALNRLAAELSDDWALFTSVPRHLTGQGPRGREIDALALSPLGAVVIEMKHFGGLITVTPLGEWFVGGKLLTDSGGNPQYPLQQAGKAAQVLKSAMGASASSIYIEACAVATRPGARIKFSDPARPQPAMSMDDVVEGIETLARRTRGVSYPALQAFFALVGHGIPHNLESNWRASLAARSQHHSAMSARHSGSRPTPMHNNSARDMREEPGGFPIGWFIIAALVGSVVGWFLLKFAGSN